MFQRQLVFLHYWMLCTHMYRLDTNTAKFCTMMPLIESRGYLLVRDNFFHPDLGSVGNLGEGVEAWRGYHSSIRPTGLGLTLNLGELHCHGLKAFPLSPCITIWFWVRWICELDITFKLCTVLNKCCLSACNRYNNDYNPQTNSGRGISEREVQC